MTVLNREEIMKEYITGQLKTQVYETRAEMGAAAAADIAAEMKRLLAVKDEINMIFAAAPSQNDVLASLRTDKSIPWEKVNAFHMDEYIGLTEEAPQSFARFLKDAIFDCLPFKSVNLIRGGEDPESECTRYTKLLNEYPTDIVVMGIGENGHIAFNDPPVADFNDPEIIKPVKLDEVCRMQQVHDGCFPDIDSVPKYALSLTVPALMKAGTRFCIVPCTTKAEAVRKTLNGPIGEVCPATALRVTDNSTMYCDRDSASLL